MKKRIASLVLSLVMCLGLAIPVFAGGGGLGYANVTVLAADGTKDLVALDKDGSGAGWSWNSASKTLTLNNFDGGNIAFDGYYADYDITLNLTGSSFIHGSIETSCMGGSFTVSGSGALTIEGPYPLEVLNTFIMASGTLTLNAIGPYGRGMKHDITMNGGKMVINAENGGDNPLTLNGGIICYTGSTSPSYAPSYSWGSKSPVVFNGGSLSVDHQVSFSTEPAGDYTITMANGKTATLNDRNRLDEGQFPAVFSSSGSGATVPPVTEKPVAPAFTDVAPGVWFAAPIQWAVENEITAGTSPTTFSPDQTCIRGQIITFIWRAAGSPESAAPANGFDDVKDTDYFSKPTQWAKEQGMADGADFAPNAPCTRAMAVEFMWRLDGAPKMKPVDNFTDVSGDASYAQAVAWALNKGVTAGTSTTTFSPDQTCTRAQIMTMLYAAFGK